MSAISAGRDRACSRDPLPLCRSFTATALCGYLAMSRPAASTESRAESRWERGTLSIEMKWEPDGFFIRLNKFSDRTCFCQPFSDVGGRRPLAHVQPSSFRLQI